MRAAPIALALLALAAPAAAAAPKPFVGALHEHSAYSDGWPGSRPADYFASGRRHGLDFMGSSEHSDNTDLPIVLSEDCLTPAIADCAVADKVNPADSLRKWDATQEQADAATDDRFTAFRGFEWSSDRFGHMNVYFSRNVTNAQADGSYASLDLFYGWAKRAPSLGGGSDGLLTFNHPGDKSLCGQVDVCAPPDDPGFNWNDFAYDPALDARLVAVETYNGRSDFGSPGAHGGPAEGWYAHALDKGWHLGAVGVEDKGHDRTDDWGADDYAKTVILASSRSRSDLKSAMKRRRFYATLARGAQLTFTVDKRLMGARLERKAGEPLAIAATAVDAAGAPLTIDLITNGGQVVETQEGTFSGQTAFAPTSGPADRYLFIRARRGSQVLAYSSPVWVTAR
jgi:hypothetical protein